MKVSLVTTVRNEAGSIDELAEAVRCQSRAPDEWVVVDGGSDDDAVARLERAGGCRVIVEAGNISHGRNVAIRHASGALIAVTDGGCKPEPAWLERLLDPIVRGEAQITAGRTRPRVGRPFDAVQWALLDQFVVGGLRAAALSARSLAFRRTVWEENPFPEWLDTGEDTWLFRAWRRRGLAIQVVEDAVVEWRLRPTLTSWVWQHFRYQRGGGRAILHSFRHAVRIAFYAGLGALVSGGAPAWAAALLAAYLIASGLRLPDVLSERSSAFTGRALALFPVALLAMDGAKIAGYASGLAERLAAGAGEGER